jgi:hypothetical protein
MNKFEEYFSNEEKIKEFIEYVHENFKFIYSKMISEMSHKLDIAQDVENSHLYVSLIRCLFNQMFDEFVCVLVSISESTKTPLSEMITKHIKLLIDLEKNIKLLLDIEGKSAFEVMSDAIKLMEP